MKVIAKQLFVSPMLGNVKQGDIIEVSESFATHLKDLGLVEIEKSKATKQPSKKQTKAK